MKCQRGDWFSHVFLRSGVGRFYFLPLYQGRRELIGNDKVFAMHLPSFTNSPKKEGGTLYAHSVSLSSVLGTSFLLTPVFLFCCSIVYDDDQDDDYYVASSRENRSVSTQ